MAEAERTGPDSLTAHALLSSAGSVTSELVARSRVSHRMVTGHHLGRPGPPASLRRWTATICRPRELGPAEVARWHELQQLDVELQHPFLSPEFALVADRVRPDARVVVVEDGAAVIGFLPFRLGPGRVASPITPGFNDLQALVSVAGVDFGLPALLAAAKLRAWTFDHLLAGHPPLTAAESASTRPGSTWVIDLPDGWNGYADWAKRERHRYFNWMERKQRRLAGEAGEYEFSYDAQDPAILRKLIEIKTDQCRAMGWREMFADDWVRRLLEELAWTRQGALTGVLSALRVNGEIVAADFSLRSASIYAGWIIAYDQAWSQLSPGAVRWRHVIEAVADAGVGRIDLGKGSDDFKRRFSTGERPLVEGTVAGTVPGARVLVSALEVVHKALAPPPDSFAARAVRRYRRRRYQLADRRRRARSGAGTPSP